LHPDNFRAGKDIGVELLPYSCRDSTQRQLELQRTPDGIWKWIKTNLKL